VVVVVVVTDNIDGAEKLAAVLETKSKTMLQKKRKKHRKAARDKIVNVFGAKEYGGTLSKRRVRGWVALCTTLAAGVGTTLGG